MIRRVSIGLIAFLIASLALTPSVAIAATLTQGPTTAPNSAQFRFTEPAGYIAPEYAADYTLEGVDVILDRVDAEGQFVDTHHATTDAAGEVLFTDLAPGGYRLSAGNVASSELIGGNYSEGGLVTDFADGTTITVGPEPVNLEIPFLRGGTLTGHILGEDDNPIEGATVEAWLAGTPTTTEADGFFRLLGLPAGAHFVSITPPTASDWLGGLWAGDGLPATNGADAAEIQVGPDATVSPSQISARLAVGASISGTITDSDGRPAPDVTVSAEGSAFASVLTAADGSYTVRGLPGGEYRIWVEPSARFQLDGYIDDRGRATADYASAGPITLTGTPVTAVDGRLANGGAAAGHLDVPGDLPPMSVQANPVDMQATGQFASVDPGTGDFDFPALKPGTWQLDFFATDGSTGGDVTFDSQTIEVTRNETTVVTVTTPTVTGRIDGEVTAPPGYILGGDTSIVATRTGDTAPFTRSAHAEADGSFHVTGLEGGVYNVDIRHPGLKPVTIPDVTVTPGETSTLEPVALVAGAELQVSVTDASGPVPGAEITLYRDAAIGIDTGTTDESGTATLSGLDADSYNYSVDAAGYSSVSGAVDVTAGAPTQLVVTLTQAATLTVRAYNDGTPLEFQNLVIETRSDTGAYQPFDIVTTDSFGEAVATVPPDADYRVAAADHNLDQGAWAGSPRSESIHLAAGDVAELTVEVNPARTITGIVTDDAGLPLTDATVTLHLLDEAGAAVGSISASGTPDADPAGGYTFGPLAAGSYAIEASHPGDATYFYDGADSLATATPIVIDTEHPGATINPVITRQVGVADIVGTVTDLNGTPIEGVQVTAAIILADDSLGGTYNVVTDGDGRYVIDVLPSDVRYRLFFASGGDTPYAVQQYPQDIDLSAGDVEADAQLEFGETITGSVRGGTVDDFTGETSSVPVEGATVLASDPADGTSYRTTTTDADGTFTLRGLAPGATVDLDVSAPGESNYLPTRVAAVATGSTADATLHLGGRVSGAISYPGDGIRYAAITLESPDGGTSNRFTTGLGSSGDGYQTGAVEPGRYLVHFESSDQLPPVISGYFSNASTRDNAREVVIEPGATTEGIDFAFETGGTLDGTVTAGGIGLRDADVRLTVDGSDLGSALTDATGAFRFDTALPPVEVTVTTLWHGTELNTFTFTPVSGEQATFPIEIDAGIIRNLVSGQITAGDPAFDGLVVFAVRSDGEIEDEQFAPNGHFQFANLPEGSYTLRAGDWGDVLGGYLGADGFLVEDPAQALHIDVIDGETYRHIQAVAERVGTVTGTVSTLAAASVAGVGVELIRVTDNVVVDSTTTDAAGGYTFGSVRPDDYDIRIAFDPSTANGFHAVLVAVTLGQGETRTVDAQLDRAGSLIAHVVDVDDAPVAGALVEAFVTDEGCDDPRCSIEGSTDASGSVTFDGLLAQPYSLHVTGGWLAGGYISTYLGGVTDRLDAEQLLIEVNGTTEVTQTLARYGTLTVAADLTDAPEADDTVTVTLRTGGVDGPIAEEQTWPAASLPAPLELVGLLPGDYTVSIGGTHYGTVYLTGTGTSADPADAEPLTVRGDGATLERQVTLGRDWVETVTTITAPETVLPGESAQVGYTVEPSAARDLTGRAVELLVDGTASATGALGDDPATLPLPTDLPVGAHTLTVRYLGGGDTRPSESETLTVEVLKSDARITVDLVGDAVYGAERQAVVTVTPLSGTDEATGEVELSIGEWTESATLAGQVATVTLPADLAVGDFDLTVRYLGNEAIQPTEVTETHTVSRAPTVTTFVVDTATPTYGDGVQVTVTVGSEHGAPTGTVEVSILDDTVTGELSEGTATVELPAGLEAGSHFVTARFLESDNFEASESDEAVLEVAKAASVLTLDASGSSEFGTATVLGVSVQGPAGLSADGTVHLLIDGDEVTDAELDGGTASLSLPVDLPVGDHEITVTYDGDAHLTPGGTVPFTHTVTAAPAESTVAFAPGTGPIEFGQAAQVRLEVTAPGVAAGDTVTVLEDGTELGQAALTAADLTDTGASVTLELTGGPGLSAGQHSLTAHYDGNAAVRSADTEGEPYLLLVTVPTTVHATAETVDYGQAASVDIRVDSTADAYPGPAGGTALVTSLTDEWEPISETIVDGAATVTLPDGLGTGGHDFTVSFDGDGFYTASTVTGSVEILPLTPAVELTLDLVEGTTVYGSSLTAEITATTTRGTDVTGTVELRLQGGDGPADDDRVLGTATLDNGTASIRVPRLDVRDGGYWLYAAYLPGPDPHFSPVVSESTPFTVTAAATDLSLTLGNEAIGFGEAVTGTVSATALGESAAGTVTVTLGDETVDATASAGGWTFEVPAAAGLGVGEHELRASFTSATPNHADATASATLTIGRATAHATISLDHSAISVGADPVGVTLGVPEAAGQSAEVVLDWAGPVTGSVTVALGADGAATSALPGQLPAGDYTVRVSYAGTANITASSADVSLLVSKIAGQVTLSLDEPGITHLLGGAQATVGFLNLPDTLAPPTGTVTLSVDGAGYATETLGEEATAFPIASDLATGEHSLGLSYSGDANYEPSEATSTLTVEKAPTELSVDWPDTQSVGQVDGSVDVRVSVPGAEGYVPDGTVTLLVDGDSVGTDELDASGTASFDLPTSLSVGGHALRVRYHGTDDLRRATATHLVTVNAAPTTVSVSGPASRTHGESVTLDVTVESAVGTPDGEVTVTDDGDVSETATLTDGAARLVIPAGLAEGIHEFTVEYAATDDYAASSGTHSVEITAVDPADPVDPVDPGAHAPSGILGKASVEAGGTQSITMTGLTADQLMDVYLHSEPVHMGQTRADGAGAASMTFTIPASLPLGTHNVEVRVGTDSYMFPFTVTAAPVVAVPAPAPALGVPAVVPPAAAGLPRTRAIASAGFDAVPLLGAASMVLLAGLALVSLTRRNQTSPWDRNRRRIGRRRAQL